MASSQFRPRDVKCNNSPSPIKASGVNFHGHDEDNDDISTAPEEAEIIIAYRLSPQRPRAITNINRRDNYSTISSLSSGYALAAPPSPVPSILPSNTGTTTPTSTSVSHPAARPQDRLSEAARRCQEWVETRGGDFHLSVLSSAPVNPQYSHGAGAAREAGRGPGAVDRDAASTTTTRKLSHTSEHVQKGTVKGDVKVVPPTDPQGAIALVFDEAVGGWGKKSHTEPGLSLTGRDPVGRETPGYSRAPEGTECLLLAPDRLQTAEQSDGCFVRRRESHMTVTSVITIQDPEQTRLDELRAEREREKKVEEQELRERNKKKPPLRLLSLDGGGTRGYTMILLLEELMHQCFVSIHGRAPDARKGERPPKPCEIFDLIGGTGIGGVIGIFLGRLRLSVAELKDMYPSLMQSILQQNKRMFGVPFRSTLFKASKLVDTLRATIRQQRIVTDLELPNDPYDSDEEGPPRESFGWTKSDVTRASKFRRSPATPNSLVSAATFCESVGVAPQHQDHAQRRKSLDDASEVWSFSDSSDRGCKGLFRGGFAKKKSLNDLRASQATSVAASEVPPVPKVDSKYLDDPTTEGHSDETLYDARAGRCRTFVTAILKGSFYDQDPALLRSYSSPAEALLEPQCAIWQACAATTAVQIMFKPVQIGQHIFHDEGPSSYNPTPSVLKEAAEHLWRGREIGCITSIGTGKVGPASSPEQIHSAERWESIGSGIASFTAARKRLALKLDACETVHREVKEKILRHYGVLNDDYFRFNVDLGWATSDLCEWESLAELNTMTKRYLGKVDVHDAIKECGRRLGALQKMKEKMIATMTPKQPSTTQNSGYDYGEPPYFKAELPADEPVSAFRPAVGDQVASCAELPTEEAIPHSNREFFPPKPLPRNFPGKRETFYIVSELPFFDKPPTSEKGCAEMNAATDSNAEPQFGGDLLLSGSK